MSVTTPCFPCLVKPSIKAFSSGPGQVDVHFMLFAPWRHRGAYWKKEGRMDGSSRRRGLCLFQRLEMASCASRKPVGRGVGGVALHGRCVYQGYSCFVQLRYGLSGHLDRRTFPSHVQNVPLWSGVFETRTWSMAETDSSGVIIPSTSQSSSTFAISLLPVSLASVMNNSGFGLRCDFPGVHG